MTNNKLQDDKIQIIKNKEIPTSKGINDYFSGNVIIDSLLPQNHSSNLSAGSVSFEPNSRTAWHSHPQGQLLIVTSGVGEIQKWGEEIKSIEAGDIVWIPSGVKHWHGASVKKAMIHISIVVMENNIAATWEEKVNME